MRFLMLGILGSALVVGVSPARANTKPAIAPIPGWVVVPPVPAADPQHAEAPVQFLLSSSQGKILPNGLENYVQYAVVPQTMAGLQAIGNVLLPWNVDHADMVLHKVRILRGDSVINLLNPEDITVLRRENNLERAMLDGVKTVVIPARGLQIGDVLEVAVSYTSKPSAIGKKPEEIQQMVLPLHQSYVERRFLVPDDVQVNWKVSPSIRPAKVTRLDGMSEHLFVEKNLAPPTVVKNSPPRFSGPVIQLSGYQSWEEVAERLRPLFEAARISSANSPLRAEAEKIAARFVEPSQRMMGALRLAQDQVRYVALLLGEGAYAPVSADETWERRFGDCKGKTALLLALLDYLGIAAEPLLVSVENNDRLGEALPSLALFDHIIVRAVVDGQTYYLDPTGYGQRTLNEVAVTSFRHGLPLRRQAALEELPVVDLAAPLREALLIWDGSNGLSGHVPFEATLTLRGASAAEMRAQLASSTDTKAFDTGLKQLVPRISNDDLKISERIPEAADGSFVVRFKGDAQMDWSPFRGERKSRYAFTHSILQWRPDFDRTEEASEDLPVYIGEARYWERLTETVILPDGGKRYSIEAAPMVKTLAGSSVSRTITQEGNRVTMVADFQHLKREISAAEARAAEPLLEEINRDFAYIVGPPERRARRK